MTLRHTHFVQAPPRCPRTPVALHAHLLLLVAVAFIIAPQGLAFAQSAGLLDPSPPTPYESDLLEARPVHHYLGLMPGLIMHFHQGSFSPNCSCSFGDESGARLLPAIEYSVHFPKRGYAFALVAAWHDYSSTFTSTFTRTTPVVGDNPPILAEYRRESQVALRHIALTPTFIWYPGKRWFHLRAGIEFGIPITARYDHVEHILTPGVAYHDGETRHVLLQESDIPGGRALRIGVSLGAGYDLYLSDRVLLTPGVAWVAPVTPVSDLDDTWKVSTFQSVLLLKVRL